MEEKKESKVLKAVVVVLAILGLITAIAIIGSYIYKKFKKMIAVLNHDMVLDASDEESDDAGCEVTEEEEED